MPEIPISEMDFVITSVPDPVFLNGFQVSCEEPFQDGLDWFVRHPAGIGIHVERGFRYWSRNHSMPFILDGQIAWNEPCRIIWDRQWQSVEVAAEVAAEFTDYSYEEPFEYNNRLYVVMPGQEYNEDLRQGNVYYSEYEGAEYQLRARVRTDLFGSQNAFRCEWVVENYARDDGFTVEHEEIDIRNDIAPVISTNIGREVPLVSFEQEFSGNGDAVAQRLYDAGFGFSPYSEAYHNAEGRFNQNPDSSPFCYIETDSSCGYEIIFSKIDLRSRDQGEKIAETQRILQEFKRAGVIRLSALCGFHVHVDVSNWAMKDVVSAYHLWNYMEDTIFRFASCFWNSHRDEETGNDYSLPVRKGHTTRREIGRTLSQRRDALNFAPFLSARGNCECDALIYEDWENCTCNLRQPTLEFRVFNATTNQRKIRAYLAFCIAFVNMAKMHQHSPEFFKEMRFRGTNIFEDQLEGKSWEDASSERINYILNNFLLTNVEKNDIVYCLKNSSLQSVMEQI